MAITVGTPTIGLGTLTGSADYKLSHACASGTKLLIFGVIVEFQSGDGSITAMRNGASMSLAAIDNHDAFACAIFYLGNPTSGTHDVVMVNTNGAAIGTNSPRLFCVDLSGDVKAQSPVGGTKITSPGIVTVQGAAGIVFDVAIGDTESAPTTTGSTLIYNNITIGIADKAGAMYITHSGTDVTTSYNTGQLLYAAAEFKEGTDFTPTLAMV